LLHSHDVTAQPASFIPGERWAFPGEELYKPGWSDEQATVV